MNKVVATVPQALEGITHGAAMVVGGFGLCGVPSQLLAGLHELGIRDLTVYSNNCGTDGAGLGVLLAARQIRRVTASYVGENKEFARQYLEGELEVELVPQGTLAERMRAGGVGIPAFYTPAGVGTPVSDGGIPWRYAPDGSVAVASPPKEVRRFDDRDYVLEEAIVADFALIHAATGDADGNLVFAKSAMNFNPLAGMAGRITIAEVETLVEPGVIPPGAVHLPGVFVQRVVQTGMQDKPIEKRVFRTLPGSA